MYDRATDYRRAVDEALFGLGEHRYEALINLLIQLRQPQLSKKPDEKLLSRALTEALPPLSPGLVTTVAEAFRGLDEERDALRALAEARGAATEFLRHYRRYAQVAAKRKATGPRQAQSRYEQLGRDLTAAEEAYAAADAELQAAHSELEELDQERTRLEARREALRQDPAMRDAGELDRRREDARQRGETAREREQTRDRLTAELTRRSAKASEAAQHASAAGERTARRTGHCCRRGRGGACAPGHREAIEGWREDLPRARRAAQEVADRQAGAIGQLERLLAEVAARRSALDAARAEVDRLTAEIQAATDRVAAAEQAAVRRAAELTAAYRAYQTGLTELRVDDPDELIELVTEWVVTGDGENPARRVIDDAARSAVDALGRQDARLSARRDAFTTTAAELTAEIGRLEAGGHDAPPAPHTRDRQVRDIRPGAPLWKVTDFAPGVPEEHRAGLEAALESAGILDAWLTPDGDLIAGDVVLVSGRRPGHRAVLRHRAGPGGQHRRPAGCRPVRDRRPRRAVRDRPGRGHRDHLGDHGRALGERGAGRKLAQGCRRLHRGGRARDGTPGSDRPADRRASRGKRRDRHARRGPRASLIAARISWPLSIAQCPRMRRCARRTPGPLNSAGAARNSGTPAPRRNGFAPHARRRWRPPGSRRMSSPPIPGCLPTRRSWPPSGPGLGDYRVALAALWPAAEAFEAARRHAAEATEELTETRQHLTEAAEQAAAARETATAAQALYEALLETAGAAVEELNRKLDELRRDTERRNADEKAARELEQTGDQRSRQGRGDTGHAAHRDRRGDPGARRGSRGVPVVRRDRDAADRAAGSGSSRSGRAVAANPHRDPGPGGQRGA